MTTNIEKANEILKQLGGNKFITMTGAKYLSALDNGALAFRLPKVSRLEINYVKIELNGMDLYDITFGKIHKNEYKVITKMTDIFGDSLIDIFEQETGLATHL